MRRELISVAVVLVAATALTGCGPSAADQAARKACGDYDVLSGPTPDSDPNAHVKAVADGVAQADKAKLLNPKWGGLAYAWHSLADLSHPAAPADVSYWWGDIQKICGNAGML